MAENTVYASVDAGNGGVNAIVLKEDGKMKTHYEPSVRAVATGNTLGLGEGLEMDYDYVDWYSNRYVTGDDVVRVTSRALERHMGASRYGEEFHRFLVAVALAKLGVSDCGVNLTVFAPPGLFKEARQSIIEGFGDKDGTVKIKLKKAKKVSEWRYESVNVYPEGIGAAAAFMLDETGKIAETDALSEQVVIVDLGAFTADAVLMSNGNFNPETLDHATMENAGVHVHIREPLLRKIHAHGDDFKVVTIDQVDQLIRKGLTTGDYTLRIAGQEMNLQVNAERYFERYADWVSNNIIDGALNGLRGIRAMILVGGGALMVEKKLQNLYPGKVLDRKKYAHTKKLHPVDMNAVGGLRLTLARVRQAK